MVNPVHALMRGLTLAIATTLISSLGAWAQSETDLLDVRIRSGFSPNPVQRNGVSGGQVSVADIVGQSQSSTGPCLGYANRAPDHIVVLETYFNSLKIGVTSQQDTTLAVQGPDGVWCNDDTDGHNPAITGQWAAGEYHVWVGAYGQGLSSPYTLSLQEDP